MKFCSNVPGPYGPTTSLFPISTTAKSAESSGIEFATAYTTWELTDVIAVLMTSIFREGSAALSWVSRSLSKPWFLCGKPCAADPPKT